MGDMRLILHLHLQLTGEEIIQRYSLLPPLKYGRKMRAERNSLAYSAGVNSQAWNGMSAHALHLAHLTHDFSFLGQDAMHSHSCGFLHVEGLASADLIAPASSWCLAHLLPLKSSIRKPFKEITTRWRSRLTYKIMSFWFCWGRKLVCVWGVCEGVIGRCNQIDNTLFCLVRCLSRVRVGGWSWGYNKTKLETVSWRSHLSGVGEITRAQN